jgi:hypothetical protein
MVVFVRGKPMVVRGYVRIWSRTEYYDPFMENGQDVYSYIALDEYDCTARSLRILQTTTYTENNLKGEGSSPSPEPTEWTYVAPGMMADFEMKYACGQASKSAGVTHAKPKHRAHKPARTPNPLLANDPHEQR